MLAEPVGKTGDGGGGGGEDYILIRHEESSGVASGTFTSGSWITRPLNTEVADTGGHASLASNQITLAAGVYRVRGWFSAYLVNRHQAKLRNITDGADLIIGSSLISAASGLNHDMSLIDGRIDLAESKVIEVQHRCQTTRSSDGFGIAAAFGVNEVYAATVFRKEA